MDAVADKGEIVMYAISEHIEFAGVHSGDATIQFPAQKLYVETVRRIKRISKQIAKELNISGPFNIQYLAKGNEIKVIECNLRASRSFPFVSKVLKINFIELATRIMLGLPVEKPNKNEFDLDYVGIKASQFSFNRLQKADPVLGVDMASTGEVGCIGDDVSGGCFEKYAFRRSPYPRKEYSALGGYAKTESGYVGCRQDAGIERLQPLRNRRDTPLSRRKRHFQYASLLAERGGHGTSSTHHAPRKEDRHGSEYSARPFSR